VEEVADWARKVLKFSKKSAQILVEQEVNGERLLVYKSDDQLLSDFEGLIPRPVLRQLWAEIEKLKKAQADSGTIQYTNH